MIKKALKYALIPVLFCIAVSLIFCDLQASKEAQTREYEEAYNSVPVPVTLMHPTKYKTIRIDGEIFEIPTQKTAEINGRIIDIPVMYMRNGELEDGSYYYGATPSVPPWVIDLLAGEEPVKFYDVSGAEDTSEREKLKNEVTPTELSLAEYVKDVYYSNKLQIEQVNSEKRNGTSAYYLIGITSLACDPQLSPKNDCEIKWYDGYDESIFEGDEPYCLIPAGKADYYDSGNGEVVLGFEVRDPITKIENGELVVERVDIYEYDFTFKIAGTYTGGDWKSVYCSLPAALQTEKEIYEKWDTSVYYHSLTFTIADNSRLEEFREKASFCFPEPMPGSDGRPWGSYANDTYNEFYPISLDIHDEKLLELTASYEEKAELHRRTTMIAIAISAVVGLAIILLTARSIKRDIDEQRFTRTIKEDE